MNRRQDLPLSLIAPVYNEGANFVALWDAITSSIQLPFVLYVVYDLDEDDTLPEVGKLLAKGESRIKLIKNQFGKGVVGAILSGFNQVDAGPVLVIMADLSDDLGQVSRMLELYHDGFDIVVGSRYSKGGRIVGGPLIKQTMSRLAGVSLHWLRGIPTCDATNAFKLYDRKMLRSITVESRSGFELNLEITVKAFLSGFRITEIPVTWTDRVAGSSKFRVWAWLPKYLRWYFYAFRPQNRETAL